jgi:hypothetical protein
MYYNRLPPPVNAVLVPGKPAPFAVKAPLFAESGLSPYPAFFAPANAPFAAAAVFYSLKKIHAIKGE